MSGSCTYKSRRMCTRSSKPENSVSWPWRFGFDNDRAPQRTPWHCHSLSQWFLPACEGPCLRYSYVLFAWCVPWFRFGWCLLQRMRDWFLCVSRSLVWEEQKGCCKNLRVSWYWKLENFGGVYELLMVHNSTWGRFNRILSWMFLFQRWFGFSTRNLRVFCTATCWWRLFHVFWCGRRVVVLRVGVESDWIDSFDSPDTLHTPHTHSRFQSTKLMMKGGRLNIHTVGKPQSCIIK